MQAGRTSMPSVILNKSVLSRTHSGLFHAWASKKFDWAVNNALRQRVKPFQTPRKSRLNGLYYESRG
jgi:hypothetical protein